MVLEFIGADREVTGSYDGRKRYRLQWFDQVAAA